MRSDSRGYFNISLEELHCRYQVKSGPWQCRMTSSPSSWLPATRNPSVWAAEPEEHPARSFWMPVVSVESDLPDGRKESGESREEGSFCRMCSVWVPTSDKWRQACRRLQKPKSRCFSCYDHGPEYRAHLLRCPGCDVLEQRFEQRQGNNNRKWGSLLKERHTSWLGYRPELERGQSSRLGGGYLSVAYLRIMHFYAAPFCYLWPMAREGSFSCLLPSVSQDAPWNLLCALHFWAAKIVGYLYLGSWFSLVRVAPWKHGSPVLCSLYTPSLTRFQSQFEPEADNHRTMSQKVLRQNTLRE